MLAVMEELAQRIGRILNECQLGVQEAGRLAWRIPRSIALPAELSIRLTEGWLLLEAKVPDFVPEEFGAAKLVDLVIANADLPGGARFCLPQPAELALRAEILLEEEGEIERDLRDAVEGIRSGMNLLRGSLRQASRLSAAAGEETEETNTIPRDLAAVCREAGWEVHERVGGAVAVPLEDGFQAVLASAEDPTARVTLLSGTSLSATTQQAAACLALSVGALVRLVRGVMVIEEINVKFLLEAPCGVRNGAEQIGTRLEALSLACQQCGKEMKALADGSAALAYLQVRGWSP